MNEQSSVPRRLKALGFGVGLGVVMTLAVGPASVAAHEANGNASCMGIELSAISPPGTSDEVPGGAPELVGDVREIAASLGVPAGAIDAFIAQTKAGSHEACDETLG